MGEQFKQKVAYFPVYAYGIPLIVSRFIKKLAVLSNSTYIFAIATCKEGKGGAIYQLTRKLRLLGLELSAAFSVKMPGNYIYLDMQPTQIAYLKIKRQESPEKQPYWENRLAEIPEQASTPIHHECNCREEACGICSIRINGVPRLSCSTLIQELPVSTKKKPIVLEPLEKFPVKKDLTVDRSRILRSLSQVKNWITTDGLFPSSVNYDQKLQQEMYTYAKCIHCGSCYDACARTSKEESRYMGPAPIANLITINKHPLGKEHSGERLLEIMGRDGIAKCGKSMNCEKVCPKDIPLVRSLTQANREIIKKMIEPIR